MDRIEPAGDLKEYTTFTSDTDLTSTAQSPIASQWGAHHVEVVSKGAGSKVTVVGAGNRHTARDVTVVADGEVLPTGWYTQIIGNKAAILDGSAENYVLVDGDTLLLEVDATSVATITFNTGDFSDIGAATAAEVAVVITADSTATGSDNSGSIRITSPTAGTGGYLRITGGTAATKLGFTSGQFDLGGDTDVSRVRVAWSSNP